MIRCQPVSAAFFTVVALAQLTRALLQLPAQVGSFAIPVWFSFVAFAATAALAVRGFWSAKGAT